MAPEIELLAVRHRFTEFVLKATVDERVVLALYHEDRFVPRESELWDYKSAPPTDSLGRARAVLQVVSFYNTFGGYLIYGVDDKSFTPCGIAPRTLNIQQLCDLVESYTGERIDLSYIELEIERDGAVHRFGLLHVPKRPIGASVVTFGKNSPQKPNFEYVFKCGQTFLRHHDACVPATTTAHFQLVCGPRVNKFLWNSDGVPVILAQPVVDHNLPDKNFICQRFVGREQVMQDLWRWLADPFVRARVLAGDGGKGKTATAYQFAAEVCRVRPDGIETVVWVTAKSSQYDAMGGGFISVYETHFHDTASLLQVLCSKLGVSDQEIDGASESLLKRLLQRAMSIVGCLIIIDDLDSISVDGQKEVMSLAQQVATPKARFLITTRMNLSYSADACIPIGGLDSAEYAVFVRLWIERLAVKPFTKTKVEQMRKLTDGSPLFTESLLRLHFNGMPIDDALRAWQGRMGDEVRRAALQRELAQLSTESRRLLLACAAAKEASFTELQQITGYDQDRMNLCVGELKALFLLSAPAFIKSEARFRVLSNTARLVLDMQSELVRDHAALIKLVERVRSGSSAKDRMLVVKTGRVGAAISQAVSLLHAREYPRALETVESALATSPKHPDLLLAGGRCLVARGRAEDKRLYFEQARRWFEQARLSGQNKEMMYELWYESELRSAHSAGAVDVADMALAADVGNRSDWKMKLALAKVDLAKAHRQANSPDACLFDLTQAGTHARSALNHIEYSDHENVEELIGHISDEVRAVMGVARREVGTFITALDCLVGNAKKGDGRPSTVEGIVRCYEELVDLLGFEGEMTTKGRNLLSQSLRQVEAVVEVLGRETRGGREWQTLSDRMARAAVRMSRVVDEESRSV